MMRNNAKSEGGSGCSRIFVGSIMHGHDSLVSLQRCKLSSKKNKTFKLHLLAKCSWQNQSKHLDEKTACPGEGSAKWFEESGTFRSMWSLSQ